MKKIIENVDLDDVVCIRKVKGILNKKGMKAIFWCIFSNFNFFPEKISCLEKKICKL